MSEAWTTTSGVLRIRFTFQLSVAVVKPTLPPPRSAIQTGVGLGRPSEVKVVRLT